MLRRVALLLCVVGVAAASGASSEAGSPTPRGGAAPHPSGCPVVLGRPASPRPPDLVAGLGTWGASAGRLVRLDDVRAPRMEDTRARAGTVVRHVVSVKGVGTAFVEDGAGTDTVVMATDAGTVRIPQRAEAVNPALARSGDLAWSVGPQLRVRDEVSGRIARFSVPREGALAFSPVFAGRSLVVAVAAPPTDAVPEDERLDDLWRVSPDGRWRRLTSFTADRDRWTAVRTPVASRGGGVDFVVIRGRASATVEPRFSLMHFEAGRVRRLASLHREMYLAGTDGAARLWNVPDIGSARVDLVREEPDGTTRTIGCGATLMDPIDVVDPDRAASVDADRPRRVPAASDIGPPTSTTGATSILVGDFATAGAAGLAATRIRGAGGIGGSALVVDAGSSPHLLRPGAHAVLLPLPSGVDPEASLAAFRATLPEYASSSWVVSV